MSLGNTASESRSPSVRHRPATSAVLPPPTGPPIPILSAPPGAALSGGWTWAPRGAALSRSSRRKEGRLRSVVKLGEHVGQRAAVDGQQVGVVGAEGGHRGADGPVGHRLARPPAPPPPRGGRPRGGAQA